MRWWEGARRGCLDSCEGTGGGGWAPFGVTSGASVLNYSSPRVTKNKPSKSMDHEI